MSLGRDPMRVRLLPVGETTARPASLDVEPFMTVDRLSHLVGERYGLEQHQFRLVFRGQVLKRDKTLYEYQISNGNSIRVVVERGLRPTDVEPPPAPPLTVPPQPICDPEIFKFTCDFAAKMAVLQEHLAQFQNTLLSNNEAEALAQGRVLVSKLQSAVVEVDSAQAKLGQSTGTRTSRSMRFPMFHRL